MEHNSKFSEEALAGGMVEESSNWVLEVEEALLDEAPPDTIRVLLAGEQCWIIHCYYSTVV